MGAKLQEPRAFFNNLKQLMNPLLMEKRRGRWWQASTFLNEVSLNIVTGIINPLNFKNR
jgi:hypothetical protein